MDHKPSASVQAFMAFGCFLVAWYFAPGPEDDPMRYFVTAVFGYGCLVGIIQAVKRSEYRPSPWPGFAGRIAWALRPRSWMVAWAAIFAAGWAFGTPHLLIEYPPRTAAGTCTYVGLWGAIKARTDDGSFNGCRLGRLIQRPM